MDIREVIEYQKERYNDELQRFDHFENKCSRFLKSITLILALIPIILSFNPNVIKSPENIWDFISVFSFFGATASLISSWFHCLSALRIGDVTVLPFDKKTTDYLLEQDDEVSYNHLFKCYNDTIADLNLDIEKKSNSLEIAYKDLIFSAWGYIVLFTTILISGI